MPQVCHLGDMASRGGILLNTIQDVFLNGQPIEVLGDPVVGPDRIIIIKGSTTVFAHARPVARTGDLVSDGSVCLASTQNVFAGG